MADSGLDGRVALVTGGSRGIGRATAIALASRGADVAVVAQSDASAQRTADAIRSAGQRALAIGCGVAKELGPPTILLNAAGISAKGAVVDIAPDFYQRIVGVNILGPFHLTKAVAPHMLAQRRGVIINMTSTAGQRPRPTRAMYGST